MKNNTLNHNKGRHYIKSSSFAMALLFTVLCGCATHSLGYFINYFTKGHLIESTQNALDAEARYVQAVQKIDSGVVNDRLYVFLDEKGRLPNDIVGDVAQDIKRLTEGLIVFEHEDNQNRYAAKIFTLEDQRKILIGLDVTKLLQDFRFMQLLGLASIIFVMIVVFVSYLISVFVANGTNNIAKTAQNIIKTGDLSQRIEVGGRWDDLSNVANALNLLLDRVQELMQGVRQVSDNIAHDLRTPLTRLRNQIEDLSDETAKEILLKETDHLLDSFNALIRISRIETQKQRSQFKDLSLSNILEDAIGLYEPLAEDKSISIIQKIEPSDFFGDRDLLFQALANLIDNAVKYTPEGGNIEISLTKRGAQNTIVIHDSGVGIAEAEQDKIFTRFYRVDSSRSTAGTGLGLSLVRAVVELHDGEIKAQNSDVGLKIVTIL